MRVAPARAAEVVFAQIASQSNPASIDNAKGLTTGIQVYFEALNAKGGVNGNKLKLEVHDDGLQAKNMVELTGKLIDNPAIVGLVGFLNTAGMTMLAKENAFGKGAIALIAPMQGDKNVVEADNVFPLRSGYADEIDALLKEAKTWGKDTVSIVNMNIALVPSWLNWHKNAPPTWDSRWCPAPWWISVRCASRQRQRSRQVCCGGPSQGHLGAGGGHAGI